MEVSTGLQQLEVEKLCLESYELAAKKYKRVIFVQDKIINFVG